MPIDLDAERKKHEQELHRFDSVITCFMLIGGIIGILWGISYGNYNITKFFFAMVGGTIGAIVGSILGHAFTSWEYTVCLLPWIVLPIIFIKYSNEQNSTFECVILTILFSLLSDIFFYVEYQKIKKRRWKKLGIDADEDCSDLDTGLQLFYNKKTGILTFLAESDKEAHTPLRYHVRNVCSVYASIHTEQQIQTNISGIVLRSAVVQALGGGKVGGIIAGLTTPLEITDKVTDVWLYFSTLESPLEGENSQDHWSFHFSNADTANCWEKLLTEEHTRWIEQDEQKQKSSSAEEPQEITDTGNSDATTDPVPATIMTLENFDLLPQNKRKQLFEQLIQRHEDILKNS
jgi:hypothetical protein